MAPYYERSTPSEMLVKECETAARHMYSLTAVTDTVANARFGVNVAEAYVTALNAPVEDLNGKRNPYAAIWYRFTIRHDGNEGMTLAVSLAYLVEGERFYRADIVTDYDGALQSIEAKRASVATDAIHLPEGMESGFREIMELATKIPVWFAEGWSRACA